MLFPDAVDQAKTGLCGIVVVVRMWAYDSPIEFVKFAIDLSEKGVAEMRGKNSTHSREIRRSATLRDAAPPPGMNVADWIVSASVRESYNMIFKDYNPLVDTFNAISCTWPRDLRRQFDVLGYTHLKGRFTPGKSQGYDNLMEASRLYRAGWRVVLFINACLLEKETTVLLHYPDHYVGLTSPITLRISTGEPMLYPFTLWAWADKERQIADNGGPIALFRGVGVDPHQKRPRRRPGNAASAAENVQGAATCSQNKVAPSSGQPAADGVDPARGFTERPRRADPPLNTASMQMRRPR